MDPRLKKALKKAEKIKVEIYQQKATKALKEKKKTTALRKKEKPLARQWIEKNLFDIIQHAEANGQDTVSLYDPLAKISDDALADAAKEIDGITIEQYWEKPYSDPDGNYSAPGQWRYSVRWSSLYE